MSPLQAPVHCLAGGGGRRPRSLGPPHALAPAGLLGPCCCALRVTRMQDGTGDSRRRPPAAGVLPNCSLPTRALPPAPPRHVQRYFNVIILGPDSSPYQGGPQHKPVRCQACMALRGAMPLAHPLPDSLRSCASCRAAGGVFKLELFLPEDYPMAAPKARRRRGRWCWQPYITARSGRLRPHLAMHGLPPLVSRHRPY